MNFNSRIVLDIVNIVISVAISNVHSILTACCPRFHMRKIRLYQSEEVTGKQTSNISKGIFIYLHRLFSSNYLKIKIVGVLPFRGIFIVGFIYLLFIYSLANFCMPTSYLAELL